MPSISSTLNARAEQTLKQCHSTLQANLFRDCCHIMFDVSILRIASSGDSGDCPEEVRSRPHEPDVWQNAESWAGFIRWEESLWWWRDQWQPNWRLFSPKQILTWPFPWQWCLDQRLGRKMLDKIFRNDWNDNFIIGVVRDWKQSNFACFSPNLKAPLACFAQMVDLPKYEASLKCKAG